MPVAATAPKPRLVWQVGPRRSASVDRIELAWSSVIPVKPSSKQLAFLFLPVREALYGGAGGGGKSIALLMAALQYADSNEYAALIIRKTFSDLSLPGALIDVASSWLQGSAKWVDDEKTWKFPGGATLTFGYLDNPKDKYRYQSSAFQYIAFDELTQFSEADYTYMFSRLRKLKGSDIPIRMRAASNPGGVGHDWVKQRFMIGASSERIFLSAKLKDNPYIDAEEYRESLSQLDPITRKQIENGDWSARHTGSKFKREWFKIVPVAPAQFIAKCRFWDLAATEPKPGKDPDWTVGALLGLTADKVLYVLDLRRIRATPGSVESLIKQTAMMDGKSVKIRMEQEPGSSGVRAIDDYKRRVLMGFDFKGVPSTGSKEIRANPLASQAEAGNVNIVAGPWIPPLLDELEIFPGGSHDDQVDALSGALNSLVNDDDKPFMIG
jgi:predicted phage terminase large subunit-like protein